MWGLSGLCILGLFWVWGLGQGPEAATAAAAARVGGVAGTCAIVAAAWAWVQGNSAHREACRSTGTSKGILPQHVRWMIIMLFWGVGSDC